MKPMKPQALLLLILLGTVASAQPAQDRAVTQKPQPICNRVPRVGEDTWRSFFMFSASGHDYTIRADGRGESIFGKVRAHNFTLKADQGHLEQVYYCELENDLVLLYEVSDQANGWGYVVRLSQTTFKPKWLAGISALNLGPALVDGEYLYLTASSLIAKLDLQSGAYVWQQPELQVKYPSSFQSFGLPWIKGDHVFFRENVTPYKTIEVDSLSGKIMNTPQ